MTLPTRIIAGAASLFVFTTGAALAQSPSDDELRAIASCREIPKSKDRLRCFERTTEILQPYAPFAAADDDADDDGKDKKPRTAVAAATPNYDDDRADPVASFGAEDMVQEDDDKRLKELTAVAVSITQNKQGKYIIALDNGQVWRQLPSDSNKLRVRKDKEGDGHDVIIKKRSLGAYALRLTTAKKSILVRRIK